MARTRSISSIEAEITKVDAELKKTREKVDALTEQLLGLQQLEQDYEAKQVMEAFHRSGKSLQELLTFLDI